jgi:uncharacterized protein (TIGR02266 family)
MSEEKPPRRRHERMPVNREFTTIEEFISEYASDISRSGVFIRSDDPLPVGTKVDLRFTLIVDEFETIEGIGEVTRIVPPGGPSPAGMGVAFLELTPKSQALLDRILPKGES